MRILNNYKGVIAFVLPILIMVLIRTFGVNHFKSDAKKWAEPSVMRSNIIAGEKTGALAGEKLIINLDKEGSGFNTIGRNALNIQSDSLLRKKNIITLRKHNGPILLFSSEIAVSARIWMVLSQMGFRDIFILTNDTDNEAFKSKFRPDTIVRPEP